MRSIEERFWSKVNKTDTCWLFTKSIGIKGYATFSVNRKTEAAHRFSYQHFVGPIPEGYCVLHKCDVRNCIRPDHLFLGSNDDNIIDKVNKNRQTKGLDVHTCKLTINQVFEIKKRLNQSYKGIQKDLALEYNVKPATIHAIYKNKTWKHI